MTSGTEPKNRLKHGFRKALTLAGQAIHEPAWNLTKKP